MVAHHGGIVRNAPTVERRLREAALRAVLVALAQQHTFTKKTPRTLLPASFKKVVVVVDQNVAHVVGMIHKEDVLETNAETTQVAVGMRETNHEVQRFVAAFVHQRAEEAVSAWAGDC